MSEASLHSDLWSFISEQRKVNEELRKEIKRLNERLAQVEYELARRN